MPFDPTRPKPDTEIDADELRAQFNGLDAKIIALPAGPKGDPGEVSALQLTDAIATALTDAAANSSANTNAVATLDDAFSDPPTLGDFEAMRAKMNELILAGRR